MDASDSTCSAGNGAPLAPTGFSSFLALEESGKEGRAKELGSRNHPAHSTHTWHFSNRYGEEWKFTFDPAKREGGLSGSDVNWEVYRVVEGRAIGLLLNDEEIQWLRQAWKEATARA